MSQDLRARILAEVAKTPSPTRDEHRRRVLLVSATGALATAAMFVAMGGMSPGARPLPMIAFTAGFALLAAILLTRVSTDTRRSMLGQPRPVLVLVAIATAPVLAALAVAATMAWPEPAAMPVHGGAHLSCAAMTLVQGALPLLVLVLPRRNSDPVHPVVTGAALGVTAGAWTVTMSYLRCAHAAALHCIVAHVGPAVLLTLIGAALGAFVLRVRARD